jgi:HD-GYP domain-containing protein (c-di-GMP phosphodiesterase class II)
MTGALCVVSLGLVVGATGNVWFAAATLGMVALVASRLSIVIVRAVDALIAAAERMAIAGCISEEFPASSPFPEVNRLADALNSAARSIHHSQADLERANLQFIETMAEALDARDPYTAGHSIRVGSYAYAIARAMDVPADEAQNIRIAAQLHDIGKIGIPDAILQKPGPLTFEEYGLIKLHPQIGRRILEKMGKFHDFLPVVELHHENHNGTGYPYKLSGDQIPLGVRIVHVADAFDSMVTHRHYRSALPLGRAIHELKANSGTQFNPEVVEVMLKLIGQGKLKEMLLPIEVPLVGVRREVSIERVAVEVAV